MRNTGHQFSGQLNTIDAYPNYDLEFTECFARHVIHAQIVLLNNSNPLAKMPLHWSQNQLVSGHHFIFTELIVWLSIFLIIRTQQFIDKATDEDHSKGEYA